MPGLGRGNSGRRCVAGQIDGGRRRLTDGAGDREVMLIGGKEGLFCLYVKLFPTKIAFMGIAKSRLTIDHAAYDD